jgi:hypothetical protein
MGTPELKVVAFTDAERHSSEAAERSGSLGFEMQTHSDPTRVFKDYASDASFFFDDQDGFEAQHVQIPIAAS